jgi:mannosyltransferase
VAQCQDGTGAAGLQSVQSTTFTTVKSRGLLSTKHRVWLLLGLVLLLATILRIYRLDAQSFWNDEGNSARLAERSIDLILAGAKGDIHPPGYYLALHFWRLVLGQSEAALRSLSVVCSLFTVGVAFALGRRLFQDETAGLLAAAFVAINPFQIYYAQEARMYAMLALWAIASTWALVAWWWDPQRERAGKRMYLFAYVLLAVAGLYTHYAFPFILLAQNLAIGVWLWRTRLREGTVRRLIAWIVAQGVVLILYAPWLPIAVRQVSSWSPPQEGFALTDALADVWRLLNFGQSIPTELVVGGLAAAGALAILSLIPPVDENDATCLGLPYRLCWLLPALLVLVPTALILGLGLYRPAYQKFLLVSSAPLSILIARGSLSGWHVASGVGVWGERWGAVGYRAVIILLIALFLFDTARSLNNLYFDETYARADYRAIAEHIRANARPGDGVILNAPNQWEVFTYYYPEDEHVYPLARQRPFDVEANRTELERIASEHKRLYGIFWGDVESDPDRFIESWLDENTYKAGETWYADVRLAVYAVPDDVADVPLATLDVGFTIPDQEKGTAIRLDGYTLLDRMYAPGDILQLALFWHAETPISDRYKVFVHLYDEAGQLVAQTDSEPGGALRPTETWSPGETIVDRYGVLIPKDTPAGTYMLAVGMYDIGDATSRLMVANGNTSSLDHLDLEQVTVVSSEDG